jgi:hypothetical protein
MKTSKRKKMVALDLEPHSFRSECIDLKSDAPMVKHRVSYVVNNVDREWIVMAKDPMDAIDRTRNYLKGE